MIYRNITAFFKEFEERFLVNEDFSAFSFACAESLYLAPFDKAADGVVRQPGYKLRTFTDRDKFDICGHNFHLLMIIYKTYMFEIRNIFV